MRTAQQIVDQTNALAREFYRLMGYGVAEGYRFDRARHPQEQTCWRMACFASEQLTGTEPDEAAAELEDR